MSDAVYTVSVVRDPHVSFRLPVETKGRWEAGARDRGYGLSEFIRSCVEAELDSAKPAGRKPPRSPKTTPDPMRPDRGRPVRSGDLGAFRGPDPK